METMGGGPVSSPVSGPGRELRHSNQTLNAVSFGFIATAVLFAMFLVMAIFERILRPHRSFASRIARDEEQGAAPPDLSNAGKSELSQANSYSKAVSVLMPGQDFPTYFARPLPPPLPPDGVNWPSHGESSESVSYGKEVLQEQESQKTGKGTTSS